MAISTVNINLSENFDHLSKAPIVEAVLEFRARAEGEWQRETIGRELRQALPDYPQFEEETKVQQQFAVTKEGIKRQPAEDRRWKGLVFRSLDRLQIAKFYRDRFSFTRLSPYTDWTQFIAEALRLWRIHSGDHKTTRNTANWFALHTIGYPFSGEIRLEDYLIAAPKEPVGLDIPFAGFYHSS